MLVKNRMTLNPFTVTPDTSVAQAYAIMQEHGFHRLPVMKKNRLVGIVTEKELQRVSPSDATSLSVFEINYLLAKMTVEDAMTKNPITIQDEELVETAAALMRKHHIGALPVMRGDRLVGIITDMDIFDAFIDMMGVRDGGARLVVRMKDEPGAALDVFTIISKFQVNIRHMALNNGRDGAEVLFRLDTDDCEEIINAILAKGYEITQK
ncbi:MAG: CBS domain-containing protein [Oscillospiraceae bacterium]|nr:CBS domain-containing protein [Oscillospiraceae bacterium]MBR2896854.1 CBS domain-containing protein [Oscillospiraceae bacterium]MBR2977756.1 CBS domain-containing protein [Oscillospiraceae bacterium]MBR3849574.1 CBS domain-containing protein [Oscillospiraceae bacterium]